MQRPIQNEEKMLYRIKADTETITVSGMTSRDVTREEAEKAAKELISTPTKPYVIEPLCTEEQWKQGTVNFCPRCGAHLWEPEEPPYASFTCSECEAELEIYIQIPRIEE